MVPLERLMGAADASGVVTGLWFIYDAIRLVRRGRAEVPMFWTQVMLFGGMGTAIAIAALWHFFFFGV